jgi:hypothetical protein
LVVYFYGYKKGRAIFKAVIKSHFIWAGRMAFIILKPDINAK